MDLEKLKEARNNRKKRKVKTTYTTGNPYYNIKMFNKRMGTDFNNPSTAEAQKAAIEAAEDTGTIAAPSPDGASSLGTGGEGGGLGEGIKKAKDEVLTEAKRYVRRYYIRPQNIFCSNKDDIIYALIEFADQDCTIYTLNNLGDTKDVTKLTNNDIIYYYEDGMLFDKNRMKIMDYDLYIKHEEERKKINIDQATDAELEKVYADRLTGVSSVDEAFNLNFEDKNAYGETLIEGKIKDDICCICGEKIEGYGNNPEPYMSAEAGQCCDLCNQKFVIPARLDQQQKAENEE